MPLNARETLGQVNEHLRSALIRLHPEQKHCSTIRPEDFTDLLSNILRAGECLRGPAETSDGASSLKKESSEYLNNLEELKQLLPDLHANLLAEKSRLESARNRIAATADWARASKETL